MFRTADRRPTAAGRTAGIASLPGRAEERRRAESIRDTERKRRGRNEQKEVIIPPCADRKRREALELDDEEWLRWYFDELFWYAFTGQQKEMIRAVSNAIRFGGDQSEAASRGEGKTKICERTLLKYTFQGIIDFSVLFAATATLSQDSLQAMRFEIEKNDRLSADYPEICVPVRALGDTPNRAHYQLVSGHRHDNGQPFHMESSKFTWCGNEIYLPNVPGSPAAHGIIATRGLDSAVRGLNKLNRRPQVAVIDDPDTKETVNSDPTDPSSPAGQLELNIERGIAQLGGQQRGCARVLLTTLQNRTCVSARFTDPKIKPSFKGRRFRFLVVKPERQDLWDEYVTQWQADKQPDPETGAPIDEHSRRAHALYLKNREEMDRGAVVANPHRFNPQTLPDGSQLEVSALQRYYNEVARTSPEAVATEFDNDPPEESGPVESGITAWRIQNQLSGYDHRVIPPGCIVLTVGIDCGKRLLHWVVRAWRADGTGFTIDYGRFETFGTTAGKRDGEDVAVRNAIVSLVQDTLRATEYKTLDGVVMPIDLILVDARWQTTAVKTACKDCGLGIYPVMGFGKSSGCAGPNFSPAQKRTENCKPGDNWKLVKKARRWIVECDADHWKRFEHSRWMTDPGKPGAMFLYGQPSERPGVLTAEQKEHTSYTKHITNEVEVEELQMNRRRFREKAGAGGNTHWLDASYYSDVAASVKGISILKPKPQVVTVAKPKKKVSYL
jgi:hypothetical protein